MLFHVKRRLASTKLQPPQSIEAVMAAQSDLVEIVHTLRKSFA